MGIDDFVFEHTVPFSAIEQGKSKIISFSRQSKTLNSYHFAVYVYYTKYLLLKIMLLFGYYEFFRSGFET